MNLIVLHLEQQQAPILDGTALIVEPFLQLRVKLIFHNTIK